MDTALTLGALVAFLAALMGDRTACALLGSLVVSKGVEMFARPDIVDPMLIAIDLAVLRVVVRPNMGIAEDLICALFVVAWLGVAAHWAGYDASGWLRRDASAACVALQLLLCLPVRRLQQGLSFYSHGPMRAGHEAA